MEEVLGLVPTVKGLFAGSIVVHLWIDEALRMLYVLVKTYQRGGTMPRRKRDMLGQKHMARGDVREKRVSTRRTCSDGCPRGGRDDVF